MSWWKRSKKESSLNDDRTIKTPSVETSSINKVPLAPLRQMTGKDMDAIKSLEASLMKAGVVGEKGEEFEQVLRIDEIIEKTAAKGDFNSRDEILDSGFRYDLMDKDPHGGNIMLEDDVDYLETMTYDGYDDTEIDDSISLEAEAADGSIALRLPDGRTIFGRIPGE